MTGFFTQTVGIMEMAYENELTYQTVGSPLFQQSYVLRLQMEQISSKSSEGDDRLVLLNRDLC